MFILPKIIKTLKNIQLIILLTIPFICNSCSQKRDDVWDMISLGAPREVTPDYAISNLGAYILKQTHEPLFRYDANRNLTSKVLNKWVSLNDYQTFEMCPNSKIEFDEGKFFTSDILLMHLQSLKVKLGIQSVVKINECVKFALKENNKMFLTKLTYLANAPTMPTENKLIHLGLGPFKVESMTSKELVLVRKKIVNNGFNKIRIRDIETLSKSDWMDRGIEDFNRIPISKVPDWVKKDYRPINVSILKTYVLVLNIENQKTRDLIANCLDIVSFRNAYFGKGYTFIDIGSVLPLGLEGAREGLIKQNCEIINRPMIKPKPDTLLFANWKPEHLNEITTEWNKFSNLTKQFFNVKNFSFNELGEMIYKTRKGYDALVLSLDTKEGEYESFYKMFFDPKGKIIYFDIKGADLLYQKLISAKNNQQVLIAVKDLNSKLLQTSLVIPLFQETRTFYYPKELVNLSVGNDYLEYPSVAEIVL